MMFILYFVSKLLKKDFNLKKCLTLGFELKEEIRLRVILIY